MASRALSSAPSARAPEISGDPVGSTRRAALGLAAAGAAVALVPAARSATLPGRAMWAARLAAIRAAEREFNRRARLVDAVSATSPDRPLMVEQVGVDPESGKPILREFWPMELEGPDTNPLYRTERARVRVRWQAFRAENRAWEDRTGFAALEEAQQEALDALSDAEEALLRTPSPDAAALAHKLSMLLLPDPAPCWLDQKDLCQQLIAEVRALGVDV